MVKEAVRADDREAFGRNGGDAGSREERLRSGCLKAGGLLLLIGDNHEP
jgi:hypothetical protein